MAVGTSEAMARADTAWLHMDRPNNLMVISGALWFDQPVDWEQLREVISNRLVERFPRFRQRVVESSLPLRGPQWEDDPDFDLDLHLHHAALPAPGDRAALQDFLSDLIAQPLDRSRPLWSWYLLDGYGSGSAIVARMHHCIADGIALARVLLSLTDSSPEAGIEPSAPTEEAAAGGGGRGITGAVGDALRPAQDAFSLAGGLTDAAPHEAIEIARDPSALADLAATAGEDVKALAKTLLPPPDASTVLKGHLGVPERVAWSDPIPLADVKAVGHARGATVNDVLVAAVAGALRSYLAGRDSLVEELRAFVPFNLRPLDQPLPRNLGNRFGLVRLVLPVGIESPLARLEEVHRRMAEIKSSPEGAVSYGMLGAIGATPAAIEQRLLELFSAAGSTVLTNVPGPREPVYLAGTPVRGVLVWAPTSGSVSMSVSIFSYDGEVTVGVMSDRGLVPDPGEIVAAFGEEVDQLLALDA
jgi:diacylglycerol O-acyltransferase / wax synthase